MDNGEKFGGDPVQFAQPIRPLHWVIKVSNLKKTLELLTAIGCRVLRHEEFTEGCEASCNGPYSGYWSKSMVGFNNEDNSFVFELTFNYGVASYKRGNDLECLLMYKKDKNGADIEEMMLSKFPEAQECLDKSTGIYRLINDDILFKFVEGTQATNDQLISGVCLNVTDMELSSKYWTKIGLVESTE